MTISDQLRAAYCKSTMSQSQIAARAGVSETTVLNIFRGRNVSTASLLAVAAVLGISTLHIPPAPQNLTP